MSSQLESFSKRQSFACPNTTLIKDLWLYVLGAPINTDYLTTLNEIVHRWDLPHIRLSWELLCNATHIEEIGELASACQFALVRAIPTPVEKSDLYHPIIHHTALNNSLLNALDGFFEKTKDQALKPAQRKWLEYLNTILGYSTASERKILCDVLSLTHANHEGFRILSGAEHKQKHHFSASERLDAELAFLAIFPLGGALLCADDGDLKDIPARCWQRIMELLKNEAAIPFFDLETKEPLWFIAGAVPLLRMLSNGLVKGTIPKKVAQETTPLNRLFDFAKRLIPLIQTQMKTVHTHQFQNLNATALYRTLLTHLNNVLESVPLWQLSTNEEMRKFVGVTKPQILRWLGLSDEVRAALSNPRSRYVPDHEEKKDTSHIPARPAAKLLQPAIIAKPQPKHNKPSKAEQTQRKLLSTIKETLPTDLEFLEISLKRLSPTAQLKALTDFQERLGSNGEFGKAYNALITSDPSLRAALDPIIAEASTFISTNLAQSRDALAAAAKQEPEPLAEQARNTTTQPPKSPKPETKPETKPAPKVAAEEKAPQKPASSIADSPHKPAAPLVKKPAESPAPAAKNLPPAEHRAKSAAPASATQTTPQAKAPPKSVQSAWNKPLTLIRPQTAPAAEAARAIAKPAEAAAASSAKPPQQPTQEFVPVLVPKHLADILVRQQQAQALSAGSWLVKTTAGSASSAHTP